MNNKKINEKFTFLLDLSKRIVYYIDTDKEREGIKKCSGFL